MEAITNQTPTPATAVLWPIELLALPHLKDSAGQPVVVQCEAIDEEAIAEIMGALPGTRPPTAGAEPDAEDNLRRVLAMAPGLIERGTTLGGSDGAEVHPAFWFNAPRPGAMPGRMLRAGDKLAIVISILKLSGYLEGAADATFPERAGDGAGLGAVAAQPGDGEPAL